MTGLWHFHSGLRFLVLFAGLITVAYCVFGLATKRPADKPLRILGAVFIGCLDLQVLLGLGLVGNGIWYPRLIGHLVMMLTAAVLAHVLLAVNRRRPLPSFLLPLIGVGGALLLIVGGILAIGRSVFAMGIQAS